MERLSSTMINSQSIIIIITSIIVDINLSISFIGCLYLSEGHFWHIVLFALIIGFLCYSFVVLVFLFYAGHHGADIFSEA